MGKDFSRRWEPVSLPIKAIKSNRLTLSLLVSCITADNSYYAISADYFAGTAHFFYRDSNFHGILHLTYKKSNKTTALHSCAAAF